MKNLFTFFRSSNLLKPIVVLCLSLFVVSCSTDNESVVLDEQLSIIDVLDSFESETEATSRNANRKPTFKTLKVALAKTGLAGTVSSNRLTVFAPTDEAFAKYGLNQQNVADFPGIVDILLYHVVEGVVLSTDLSNSFVPTLNGAAVEVNLDNGVVINTSNVIRADILARNGVIHAIDDILFPPTQNIAEIAISQDPEFSILVKALVLTGLVDAVTGDDQLTVFAPINSAFEALGLTDENIADQDPEFISSVLLYHVVAGRVYSSDLSSGMIPTLNGASFELDLDTLSIAGNGGSVSNLVPSLLNIQATNGVIHVIDQVILP